ncbi:MAG: S-DNA-T family DNA segregation ATPase FtsK/SpoIIIE [Gammaproteobacteria bacterium]
MARNQKNTKTKKLAASRGDTTSRLGRELMLIAIAAVVFYLFVCLFSYHPQDPGWSFSGADESIHNFGGKFGAWFADVVLQVFGYVAFTLPFILLLIGWRMFKGLVGDPPSMNRRILHSSGVLFTLVALSGMEHLHFYAMASIMPFAAGGVVGALITEALTQSFGIAGATVVFLVALAAGVTWVTDLSWFRVMDWTGYQVFELISWAKNVPANYLDHYKGKQSVKQRQVKVTEIRKEMDSREPPRIEPKMQPIPDSGRKEKERQTVIFNVPEGNGALPALALLDPAQSNDGGFSREALEHMSRLLEKKLKDFNIEIKVEAVQPGPVITRFEIEPAPGVKASQIVSLSRDLARALSVVSIRVVENIPGKTVIGLEVPNESREMVSLIDGLAAEQYERSKSPLTIVMGKDIAGQPVVADLAKMPHVLIAGTTGSGKSVCINAFILSLLYKSTPEDVRLIMVDPKMLELSVYENIPHLLAPVVTDMQKAANALRWCIVEMDRRFRLMAAVGVRNMAGYNRKVISAAEAGKPILDPLMTLEDLGEGVEPPELTKLPYIVVVVDELADLMMVVGKKIEELIIRIAQRARAAGIHLVLATQRPSVDVVTGLIKANVPTRVAFQVSSRADSRVVIDQMGAESLLGHGDMLFLPPGTGLPVRVHGSFVSDQEVQRVADSLRLSGYPDYIDEITNGDFSAGPAGGFGGDGGDSTGGEGDPLYDQALRFVTETRRASISAVQRQLRVGYNRAARMIESMEASGVVGPSENGKRAVLAPPPAE